MIVNPVAGLGGAVALKGSDGAATIAEALRRGARPRAALHTTRALDALARRRGDAQILAGAGALGADLAAGAGFAVRTVAPATPVETTADDTRRTAAAILAEGADVLLFAGGDGTARDIFDVVGAALPMIGIPAGVKMHSAVFARTPDAAGEAAARFVDSVERSTHEAEVMDIDEAALREGRVGAELHGYAATPRLAGVIQSPKSAPRRFDEAALDAAARDIARDLDPARLYLIGPGTTTRRVMRALGHEGSLLGIDAVAGGRVLGLDLTAHEIEAHLAATERAGLILGVIGGQGCLLGRGNQQLTAAIVRRVGLANLTILAALEKIAALEAGLFVDTGDRELDDAFAGYRTVHTGPRMSSIVRIDAARTATAA
ncbi:NAD(+)/NADH kinase [Acuticoccus sp. M5D2P5]|uniref:ATP-NAD kinase family protein n=1 Tax=Acuticoccus kalidii TaxID=2910977 RepID=UPI001F1BA812|nr:NAD(+)/NADH kinase [Acuticoccus kalidii]MCF3932513.1 NAD(+)/NADH kinase [Acuticoccus kalidii]